MRIESFWLTAAKRPERIAVIGPDGEDITAGDLLAAGNRIAHGLRALGVQPGDGVAFMLPNGREVLELLIATMQIGVQLAPLSTGLSTDEITHILSDSGAKAFITHERFADRTATAAVAAELPESGRFAVGEVDGFASYASLGQGESDARPEDRSPGAFMVYTSGTTGRAKGIVRALLKGDVDKISGYLSRQLAKFDIEPGGAGVHLCTSPLYHTAPIAYSWYTLHFEHTLVLMKKWDAEDTLRLIDKHRVTHSHMVPTQFHRLLRLPKKVRDQYDVSSLSNIIHAAAPCPVDTKHEMLAWWGPVIYEYYGASEGGGTLVTPQEWLMYPGTVGRPWPGAEIRIYDGDGELCPTDEPGNVYMLLNGAFKYRGDDAKTQEHRRGDFFTVGDVGYLNEDGYLFLCDRKIDMIISGGVNIYPAEVEAALLSHPKVADATVFGIPDEEWGEQVKAVVELVRGQTLGDSPEDTLRAHCTDKIAKFKVPKSIDFTEALPRDPNGKLQKRKLRDPYWADTAASI